MSQREPLRAVFLDVGNTLVREEPSRFAIYAEAACSRGAELDERAMLGLMRRAHEELPPEIDGAFRYSDPWFEAYIGKIFHDYLGLAEAHLPAITAELFGRFEDPRTFRLFAGADTLLDACRERGLTVGVVSNWSARLPRVLAAVGLAERLDFVVCSAIVRQEKPDPAIFHTALEHAGVPPTAVLHAGDHPDKDGAAALDVGIAPVLVDHAGALAAGAAPGIPRVTSLGELQSLILARLPREAR
ncbi:MAG: HAD-IA family hydrolase [Planctomycetota bacterium]